MKPAGVGQCFYPRCDVDAVAEDVAVLEDDVAQVYADAERHLAVFRVVFGSFGHRCLDLNGALDRFDGAGELGQKPITRFLNDMALMFGDRGLEDFVKVRRHSGQGSRLINTHEPAVADDIRRQNRGKLAGAPFLRHLRSTLYISGPSIAIVVQYFIRITSGP